METMLSALNNTENLKIKELAVSAIGAIGKRLAKDLSKDLLCNLKVKHNRFYLSLTVFQFSPKTLKNTKGCCSQRNNITLSISLVSL